MIDAETREGCLTEYLRDVSEHPLLTPDEELQLAKEMSDGRRAARQLAGRRHDAQVRAELEQRVKLGEQARARLIESNLRLVVSVARRYRGKGLSLLDLIQEGNIGLQIGVDKYDWRKGYRLSTYVYWWIRQTITRALANDSRIIRLPVHAGEVIRDAAAAEAELERELGRTPTTTELAVRIGVRSERLGAIRQAAAAHVSLDLPLQGDTQLTRGDLVEDEAALESMEAAGQEKELAEQVADVLGSLPPREREVLRLRYGLGRPETFSLAQIGRRLGVTRERARQLERQALRRLRGDVRLRRALLDLASA